MYSPSYNRLEDRAELLEFMRANSFALLVTGTGGTLHASHLPVMVQEQTARNRPRHAHGAGTTRSGRSSSTTR